VWHDGKLDVAPGTGRFVELPPFSPTLYGGLERQGASSAARITAAFASRNGPTPMLRSQPAQDTAAGGAAARQEL
jgi:hypothetical protein